MAEFKILISPDGNHFYSLYHDKLGLQELGDLEIERATEVFWDGEYWRVKVLATGEILDGRFTLRGAAVDHEIEYLQEHFEELCPYLRDDAN